MMGKDEIILERKSGKNNTIALFLGLYLLILAFLYCWSRFQAWKKYGANKLWTVFRPRLKHSTALDGIDLPERMREKSSPAKLFRNVLPISLRRACKSQGSTWRGPGGR